ncbi:hypothetical protein PR048_024979 [Dryococelus australis]|uniref:Uncharacterized protein n=1 Tax=Dryococelus australis TaxID=614101 RepID=A0ABQ9GQ16_9NEOP|nr:hypothetical protein PR048_024979 [Dryococelus australis]
MVTRPRPAALQSHLDVGATVAERFVRSPPTKAIPGSIPDRVTPDFRMWESCRTMPLVGEFSREFPVSAALSFRRCSKLASNTLIGSQDLEVKSRPKLFTHSSLPRTICLGSRSFKVADMTSRSGALGQGHGNGVKVSQIQYGCWVTLQLPYAFPNKAKHTLHSLWLGNVMGNNTTPYRNANQLYCLMTQNERYGATRKSRQRLDCSNPTKETGFNPQSGHSRFSQAGIVPDDAAARRIFSGIFIPALLHIHLASSSSALKTSL